MEATKHITIGTAGHIDHGKSSLVEALTGTHPDRLEEEKRRGITIDLGFAFLDLGGVRIGFVDVPGHERFVRNMLAGVGGIDLVLLVVAADESIKPQTREHFDICCLLGIRRGLVAITKSDLVDSVKVGFVREEIEKLTRGTFLEGAPVIPVSVPTEVGLDALKQELVRASESIPARDTTRHLRLPIDRSFSMRGFGTVVTGTLVSGSIATENEVELYPLHRRVRVRGLHSAGQPVERAVAGQRTAVNLAGIEHGEVRRGMVLGPSEIFETTRRFDARLTLLPRALSLKNRARTHFHQGTAEIMAEVILLDRDELAAGETGLAQLRLETEALLLPGDRFILRQFSPVVTIGGGVVIDPGALRHRRRDPRVQSFLETLDRGNPEETLAALLESSPEGLGLKEILARTGWTEPRVREVVKKLATGERLRILRPEPLVVASARVVARCADAVGEAVEAFHRVNPLERGVPRQDLRGRVGHPRSELFELALDDLEKRRVVTMAGDLIQRSGRVIELTPEEAHTKELIEREFERAGLSVPSVSDVVAKMPIAVARAEKVLEMLLRDKVLIKIGGHLVFHHTALRHLGELLIQYRKQHGERLSISAFKELTGVTRKYAIPLLEYLDLGHVTRRVGHERVIL
jgi:selenocysteine-specific elongation factor